VIPDKTSPSRSQATAHANPRIASQFMAGEEATRSLPERERLRRGQLLKLLAIANLPLNALLLPSTFVPHLDMISFAALLIYTALILGSLWLNRLQKVEAGANLYLASTILACSMYLFFAPPHDFLYGCYVYAFYGIAVVNSGFLLGRNAPFAVAAICIGFVSAHVGLHLKDFHALPGFADESTYIFALLPDVTLFMLAVLSWLGAGSMEEALLRADQADYLALMHDELRTVHGQLLANHHELEQANAKLEALATTDGMTGLLNHRAFQERLREELARRTRSQKPLALMLLDVDHFKQYNDSFGHPAGDETLRLVAELLRTQTRATDFPARYGGEEFVIILTDTDLATAQELAERLRLCICAHPFPHRQTTVSIGLSSTEKGFMEAEALIASADAALYNAKRSGRNQSVTVASLKQAA
jgi:diguanylate cyclase (GGDEF)-like protein